MTTRSLMSRRGLEETKEATASNFESEIVVMSGEEVNNLALRSVRGGRGRTAGKIGTKPGKRLFL